ncbi:MAG: hypothetical protein ACKOT0_07170 [bacterium]
MNLWTRVGVAAGLVALGAVSMGSAQAADVPADLEYSYSLDQPLIGNMSLATKGDCTQTLGGPFTLAMTGGVEEGLTNAVNSPGNDVTCTLSVQANTTGSTVKGTVSASSAGQSGSGNFTLVCDVGRSMDSWFRILVGSDGTPALAPDPYGVESDGYLSCNWVIDVNDQQKSQLSGTLEMQGSFSLDSTPVDWSYCAPLGLPIPEHALKRAKCVQFDMDIQAALVGATGAYEGRTGSGSMTQVVYAPLIIPISLDGGATPPPPPCPPEQQDCTPLDLTGCQYSPTNPGDPSWLDLSQLPPGAQIPGFQGPGWYKCGDGGGGGGGEGGLTGCQYSPTEQTGPGWSYIELPPGVEVPGYQGPGWYNCGDAVPPPTVDVAAFDQHLMQSAFSALVSPRSGGDLLSLSTKKGAAAPRFVSPAKTGKSAIRDFSTKSSAAVRLATVPGATCSVSAKAGSVTASLVRNAKAVKGLVDTKVTAVNLIKSLKAKSGAQATLTATCSAKSGKRTVRLPTATVTVKFT